MGLGFGLGLGWAHFLGTKIMCIFHKICGIFGFIMVKTALLHNILHIVNILYMHTVDIYICPINREYQPLRKSTILYYNKPL